MASLNSMSRSDSLIIRRTPRPYLRGDSFLRMTNPKLGKYSTQLCARHAAIPGLRARLGTQSFAEPVMATRTARFHGGLLLLSPFGRLGHGLVATSGASRRNPRSAARPRQLISLSSGRRSSMSARSCRARRLGQASPLPCHTSRAMSSIRMSRWRCCSRVLTIIAWRMSRRAGIGRLTRIGERTWDPAVLPAVRV